MQVSNSWSYTAIRKPHKLALHQLCTRHLLIDSYVNKQRIQLNGIVINRDAEVLRSGARTGSTRNQSPHLTAPPSFATPPDVGWSSDQTTAPTVGLLLGDGYHPQTSSIHELSSAH